MIEKNKYLIQQDELKKEKLKEDMKVVQDQLYQESLDMIKRKQDEKLKEW